MCLGSLESCRNAVRKLGLGNEPRVLTNPSLYDLPGLHGSQVPKGRYGKARGNAPGIVSHTTVSPEGAGFDDALRPYRAAHLLGTKFPGRCPGLSHWAPLEP